MLFDANGFLNPKEYDFAINLLNDNNIYNKDEALVKGNLYKDLYVPYRNYKEEKVKVYNEQDKDMLALQELCFVINDLNLYLDLHPEDNNSFKIFKDTVKSYKEKKKEYVKKWGPIDLLDKMDDYEWTLSLFPWEDNNV